MAKNKDEKKRPDMVNIGVGDDVVEAEVIADDDPRAIEYYKTGKTDGMPDNFVIGSSYGLSRIDQGSMQLLDSDGPISDAPVADSAATPTATGAATGGDGNTGSSAGGATNATTAPRASR